MSTRRVRDRSLQGRLIRSGQLLGLVAILSGSGLLGLGLIGVPRAEAATTTTATFSYSAQPQGWTVPPGVTQATFDLFGSAGQGALSNEGGQGGETTATIAVTPGQTYWIVTGAPGSAYGPGTNGGGAATPGGPGGGGTDVSTDGADSATRLIVAGGGGGAGADTFFDQGARSTDVP
ncbi:MAG: glycine-rich protein, partial [Candidatus Dormiibacterota bacterium]